MYLYVYNVTFVCATITIYIIYIVLEALLGIISILHKINIEDSNRVLLKLAEMIPNSKTFEKVK